MSHSVKMIPLTDDSGSDDYCLYVEKNSQFVFVDIDEKVMEVRDVYESIRTFNPGAMVVMRVAARAEQAARSILRDETCWIIREPYDTERLISILKKDEHIFYGALILAIGGWQWFGSSLNGVFVDKIDACDRVYESGSEIVHSLMSTSTKLDTT